MSCSQIVLLHKDLYLLRNENQEVTDFLKHRTLEELVRDTHASVGPNLVNQSQLGWVPSTFIALASVGWLVWIGFLRQFIWTTNLSGGLLTDL